MLSFDFVPTKEYAQGDAQRALDDRCLWSNRRAGWCGRVHKSRKSPQRNGPRPLAILGKTIKGEGGNKARDPCVPLASTFPLRLRGRRLGSE